MNANQKEELKRDYDNWLLAINRDFPDKGFDVSVEINHSEFTINFTPRHTTPMIFFQTERGVTQYLAAIYQTLTVLQINKTKRYKRRV